MNYYDRKGNPISGEECYTKENQNNRIVRRTSVGNYAINTVWLGLDHNYDGGKPLIFETMVFRTTEFGSTNIGDYSEIDMDRYSTEEEAIVGHYNMVEKWRVK